MIKIQNPNIKSSMNILNQQFNAQFNILQTFFSQNQRCVVAQSQTCKFTVSVKHLTLTNAIINLQQQMKPLHYHSQTTFSQITTNTEIIILQQTY